MKLLRQTQKGLEASARVTNRAHSVIGRGKKEKTLFSPQEIAETHSQQKEERANCTYTKSSGIAGNELSGISVDLFS